MIDVPFDFGLSPEELIFALLSPFLYVSGVLTGLVISFRTIKFVAGMKAPKKKFSPGRVEAKNSAAVRNASVDFQKIKTAEIEIPVIAADVLVYEGGELGEAYPERTRLYYAPEALSDPEYLQTVLRSPLQIQTHEKNTSEFNRGVDGWPLTVEWDEAEQRVKVMGVLHGEENVKYAQDNQNKPNFGTSAFISFLKIDRTPGTSPGGKPYDAVVRKAVNNHIAILPNVRDSKNVILAMNAVESPNAGEQEEVSKWIKELSAAHPEWKQDQVEAVAFKKAGEGKNMAVNAEPRFDPSMVKTTEEKKKELEDLKKKKPEGKNVEYDEFKGHMNAYEKEKAADDELVNTIVNRVKNELNPEGKKEEGAKDSKNSDTEELKKAADGENAANAFPSEAMVKDFSDALGVTFKKTPSFKELASYVPGVTGATDAELVTALNAKRAELTAKPAAKNSETGSSASVDELLKSM